MGELISLEQRMVPDLCDFVSYTVKTPLGPRHIPCLIIGIEWEKTTGEKIVSLWVLGENKSVPAPLWACKKLHPKCVTGGLLGLRAVGPLYSGQMVVRETVVNGVLHVILRNKDGRNSLPIPIHELRFSR